jgi:hypothetical protein
MQIAVIAFAAINNLSQIRLTAAERAADSRICLLMRASGRQTMLEEPRFRNFFDERFCC